VHSTKNPVTVQVVVPGFFQTGVFSTSVASQRSLAAISWLTAVMAFFAVKWKKRFSASSAKQRNAPLLSPICCQLISIFYQRAELSANNIADY